MLAVAATGQNVTFTPTRGANSTPPPCNQVGVDFNWLLRRIRLSSGGLLAWLQAAQQQEVLHVLPVRQSGRLNGRMRKPNLDLWLKGREKASLDTRYVEFDCYLLCNIVSVCIFT